MENNLQIIATFTKILKKNKIGSDQEINPEIHLVSSIVRYEKEIDFFQVIEQYSQIKTSKTLCIVFVGMGTGNVVMTVLNNIIIQYVSINSLLLEEKLDDVYTSITNLIKSNVEKDSNIEVVFIFKNISWSNIILMFRLKKIYVSGGYAVKRHNLSITQLNLVKFLILVEGYNIDTKILYNSMNDKLCSPFIDEESYKLRLTQAFYDANRFNKNPVIYNFIKEDKQLNLIVNNRLKFKESLLQTEFLEKEVKRIEDKIDQITESLKDLEYISSSGEEILIKGKISSKDKKKKREDLAKERFLKKMANLRKELLKNKQLLQEVKVNKEREESNIRMYYKESKELEKLEFTLVPITEDPIFAYLNNISKKYPNSILKYSNDKLENEEKYLEYEARIRKIRQENWENTYRLKDLNQKREYSTSLDKTLRTKNQLLIEKLRKKNFIFKKQNISSYSNDERHEPIFSYLDMIKNIIRESNNDVYVTQRKIETEWIDLMKNKLNDPDYKLRNSMVKVIKLASETLELDKKRKLLRKFPKLYDKLNEDHLLITFSIISRYIDIYGFTALAMNVSRNILFNIYKKELKKQSTDKVEYDIHAFENFKNRVNISNNVENLKLGSYFLEIFCSEPTDVFYKSYRNQPIEDYDYDSSPLSILEINLDFIDIIKKDIIIEPTSLPMICPPNPWSDFSYGGFLENNKEHHSLITGSSQHSHTILKKEKLYKAINYLNNIKFVINTSLLHYLENEGKPLLDAYINNLKSHSEKLQTFITLKIAKIYLNLPFFIPTNADWRSRIYTQSFFLSYQGNDLASSLINFNEGEPLNDEGKKYLYIFGANCYNINNLSKKSYNFRIQWVINNYDSIIKMDHDFILKADSKFMFIAFCLVMKELEENTNTCIRLPVFLDATCSGIQHLAALLRDFETGSKVNLIPQNEDDTVGDIYNDLINPINQAIQKYGKENESYKILKDIKLTREFIKPPVMTKVYNVTVKGITQQLISKMEMKEKINKKDQSYFYAPSFNGKITITYPDIFKIAQIINEQIFISFPSLKYIYEYFKEIIKFMLKLNLPVTWFTPSGMEITQAYNISKQNKVSITFGKVSRTVTLREKTLNINKMKQVQAIIPNIIHSLDASHLINLINTSINNKLSPIISVHDCFGTHPNKIPELTFLVKKEFILIYTQPAYLTVFNERFKQSLQDNHIEILKDQNNKEYVSLHNKGKLYVPIVPKLGNLNIEQIINSKYMIT